MEDQLKLLHETLIDAKQAYKEGNRSTCRLQLHNAVARCNSVSMINKIQKVNSLMLHQNYRLAINMLSDVTREVNVERKRQRIKKVA